MNDKEYKPYGNLMAFGMSAVVTGFTVPNLAGPMIPHATPWLVVITGTAVCVVAAVRLAISASGGFRIFGFAAALASLSWLVLLAIAIKDI